MAGGAPALPAAHASWSGTACPRTSPAPPVLGATQAQQQVRLRQPRAPLSPASCCLEAHVLPLSSTALLPLAARCYPWRATRLPAPGARAQRLPLGSRRAAAAAAALAQAPPALAPAPPAAALAQAPPAAAAAGEHQSAAAAGVAAGAFASTRADQGRAAALWAATLRAAPPPPPAAPASGVPLGQRLRRDPGWAGCLLRPVRAWRRGCHAQQQRRQPAGVPAAPPWQQQQQQPATPPGRAPRARMPARCRGCQQGLLLRSAPPRNRPAPGLPLQGTPSRRQRARGHRPARPG